MQPCAPAVAGAGCACKHKHAHTYSWGRGTQSVRPHHPPSPPKTLGTMAADKADLWAHFGLSPAPQQQKTGILQKQEGAGTESQRPLPGASAARPATAREVSSLLTKARQPVFGESQQQQPTQQQRLQVFRDQQQKKPPSRPGLLKRLQQQAVEQQARSPHVRVQGGAVFARTQAAFLSSVAHTVNASRRPGARALAATPPADTSDATTSLAATPSDDNATPVVDATTPGGCPSEKRQGGWGRDPSREGKRSAPLQTMQSPVTPSPTAGGVAGCGTGGRAPDTELRLLGQENQWLEEELLRQERMFAPTRGSSGGTRRPQFGREDGGGPGGRGGSLSLAGIGLDRLSFASPMLPRASQRRNGQMPAPQLLLPRDPTLDRELIIGGRKLSHAEKRAAIEWLLQSPPPIPQNPLPSLRHSSSGSVGEGNSHYRDISSGGSSSAWTDSPGATDSLSVVDSPPDHHGGNMAHSDSGGARNKGAAVRDIIHVAPALSTSTSNASTDTVATG